MKGSTRFFALAALLVWAASFGAVAPDATTSHAPVAVPRSMPSRHLAPHEMEALALPFLANQGQVDGRVSFYAPLFAGTVFVTREGEIVYSLPAKSTAKGAMPVTGSHASGPGWVLTEHLLTTATLNPKPEGAGTAHADYLIGRDPSHWRHGLPTYESVSLGEAWPGIEVSLTAHANNVESFYKLAAGVDAGCIRLRLDGAKRLEIKDGRLLAETGLGTVAFTAPEAWQTIGAEKQPVEVRYTLHGREYGFTLGAHDPSAAVMIDPEFQATYVGDPTDTTGQINGFAVGPDGDVYVTGDTNSTHYPGTAPGAHLTHLFVAKLNPQLTALEQATYLGGSGIERGGIIALDTTGDVYVAGTTSSSDFPGITGGAQSTYPDQQVQFVAKLDPNLTTVYQSTYLGSSISDVVLALAVGADGDVYAAGETPSTSFPGTSHGPQPIYGGGAQDGFVVGLNSSLTSFINATYLGGSKNDLVTGLAVDAAGDVYVAGYTNSSNFPGTSGGAQATINLNFDVFVTKLDAGLTTIKQSTYFGGPGNEEQPNIALDSAGDVYIAGTTDSNASDLPHVAGGAQATNHPGGEEAFVAKLNSGLTSVIQATYLGGSGNDRGLVSIAPDGDVYVSGITSSTDFPGTSGGIQTALAGGGYDLYVARLNPGLTILYQATYLGGSGTEFNSTGLQSEGPGFDAAGDVYMAGATTSTDFPGTVGGAEQTPTHAFAARLPSTLEPQVVMALSLGAPASSYVGAVFNYDLSITNDSTHTQATSVVLTDVLPAGVTFVSSSASQGSCGIAGVTVTCNLGSLAAGGYATVTITVRATTEGAAIDNASIQAGQDIAAGSVISAQVDTRILMLTANAGSLSTTPDKAVMGTLSATAAYPGQTFTFTLASNPAHGTVKQMGTTSRVTYTPATGYAGTDSFTFTVTGSDLVSNTATESITVTDIAPKAINGGILTRFAQAHGTVSSVLPASTAYAGQSLSYSVVSQPAHGTVTITNPSTGAFTYTMNPGYSGNDGFTFRVMDQWGASSNTATVSIRVY